MPDDSNVVSLNVVDKQVSNRWKPRRKALLLKQIDDGLLTEAEAIEQYELSVEELAEWRTAHENHGMAGLRITRSQFYRGRHTRFTR
jgi:hypothetical protein